MSITLNIPAAAEEALRDAWGQNLDRVALEALAAEGYRSGKLSSAEIGVMLGFDDRWAVEQWLTARNIPLQYSLADLEADRQTLDRILGPAPR